MASSIDFLEFILEQLRLLDNIQVKTMMGEYLLYYKGILFGGIYDDRFLIKKTETNKKFNLPEEIPYNGAKSMYLIEDVDNAESVKEIVISTYNGLRLNQTCCKKNKHNGTYRKIKGDMVVEVLVLKEIELIGVVAVLAHSSFMKIRNNKKYVDDIFSYFKNYENHEVVKYYKILEEKYVFNYDKPISLVLDYKDDGRCSRTLCNYVGKEAILQYSQFYNELINFKNITNFDNFYNLHIKEYSLAIEIFKKKTDIERCIQFLEEITKEPLNKNYIINLMFAVTSANYGWQTKNNCYCNIRPYKTTYIKDSPSFSVDKIYVETLIVHEFGHSIINPITEKFKKLMSKLDQKKFEDCFKCNPYGDDKATVINESIIRAIECLYVEKYFTKKDLQNLLLSYKEEGFDAIGDLMDIIKDNSCKKISSYYELLINKFI